MYAMQEPIVGFIAGLLASVCRWRKSKTNINILIDVLIQQISLIAFGSACYIILIIYLTPNSPHASLVIYK
jgi:CHASE2 domain-containing sensor protein